jgi:hypothetical protein
VPVSQVADGLIPRPRRVTPRDGRFLLSNHTRLQSPVDLEPPELLAIERFLAGLPQHCRPQIGAAGPGQNWIRLAIPAKNHTKRGRQGYHLHIRPEGVEVIAGGAHGLTYALATLGQIAAIAGADWPCLDVDDQPHFAVRGLSFDISRGRVPKLQTLLDLVDRLAALKVNHLELYVEHTIALAFNPRIGEGCSPLTPDEVRALDRYCAERRIQLAPSIASFGHMGFILGLPEYRHLAEIPPPREWHELTWRQRVQGATLDASNPEARALIEQIYAEILPLFSGFDVNVCCDETYDLGRGRGQARAQAIGAGRMFLEHLCWLHDLCQQYGRRMLFWGDIIKNYPALIPEIPRDAVALHWDYLADADYTSTRLFRDAGLETYVCPGTSSWNRILNDLSTAETNIRRFTSAGVEYGAAGLLNTDWGDDGNVNLLAGSWHPIALGAAMGWNPAAPRREVFDAAFGRMCFGEGGPELVDALRAVTDAGSLSRVWPSFYGPLDETYPIDRCSDEDLALWREKAERAAAKFSSALTVTPQQALDLRELDLGCRISGLFAEKFQLARQLEGSRSPTPAALGDFAARCRALAGEYEALWLERHKPSLLHEILAVFNRLADEAVARAGRSRR